MKIIKFNERIDWKDRFKFNPETGTSPDTDERNKFLDYDHPELDEIKNRIIEILNEADEKLTPVEFEKLAESIISYIDDIKD